MKKMPTLFKRTYNDDGKIMGIEPIVTEGCEWVMNGEGTATQKLDGTCCCIENGVLYARYDAKNGKTPPTGAVPCQPEADPITGHWPHWVPVNGEQYKYHREAFLRQAPLIDGTYELCGKHFQKDPEHIGQDTLILHGSIILDDVVRTFDDIAKYLYVHDIEGIVFHRGNGEMCKIKGSDFGFCRSEQKGS